MYDFFLSQILSFHLFDRYSNYGFHYLEQNKNIINSIVLFCVCVRACVCVKIFDSLSLPQSQYKKILHFILNYRGK